MLTFCNNYYVVCVCVCVCGVCQVRPFLDIFLDLLQMIVENLALLNVLYPLYEMWMNVHDVNQTFQNQT